MNDDAMNDDPAEQVVAAMLAVVRTATAGGLDFAAWLAGVLARVAGMSGGVEALVAGRPGSWESDKVRDFVLATVGYSEDAYDPYLPQGWRPPLGSAALYEAADHTLYLVTRPWDGGPDQPGTVYVRCSALFPEVTIESEARAWFLEQAEPNHAWRWSRLGAGDVAELLARDGADIPPGQPAPGVLLGQVERTTLSTGDDVIFLPEDLTYLQSRPLAVQRYCLTEQGLALQDEELEAILVELDELAVLAGEHDAQDLAAGVGYGVDAQNRQEVTLLYATALGLARHDDTRFDRAQQIKTTYDQWWTRWHAIYTDAQPEGVSPLGI